MYGFNVVLVTITILAHGVFTNTQNLTPTPTPQQLPSSCVRRWP